VLVLPLLVTFGPLEVEVPLDWRGGMEARALTVLQVASELLLYSPVVQGTKETAPVESSWTRDVIPAT